MNEDALEKAVDLAIPFEGFSSPPYQDPVGVWTQGYGSIRDADGNRITADSPPISAATAKIWAENEMRSSLQAVESDVQVPMTTEEEAALADFVYNLGSCAFAGSRILRYLNAGNFQGAADDLMLWNHAGGQVLAGLTRRRAAERDLMLSGGEPPTT
jgi:GH24 family phage-related lysozyme (muramidase)